MKASCSILPLGPLIIARRKPQPFGSGNRPRGRRELSTKRWYRVKPGTTGESDGKRQPQFPSLQETPDKKTKDDQAPSPALSLTQVDADFEAVIGGASSKVMTCAAYKSTLQQRNRLSWHDLIKHSIRRGGLEPNQFVQVRHFRTGNPDIHRPG